MCICEILRRKKESLCRRVDRKRILTFARVIVQGTSGSLMIRSCFVQGYYEIWACTCVVVGASWVVCMVPCCTSINATHSAMLTGQRCNSDVQLPYRFPIIPETHRCDSPACLQYSEKMMVEATQIAQDAQAGYACD